MFSWFQSRFREYTAGYYIEVVRSAIAQSFAPPSFVIDVAPREGVDLACGFHAETWQQSSLLTVSKGVRVTSEADLIIGVDLVNYAEDIQWALQEIRALAKDDTRIVLTKINPLWSPLLRIASWLKLVRPRTYANWISRQQFAQFLSLSGLECIRRESLLLLPVRIPLLSWFVNTYLARLPLLRRLCLVEMVVCRARPGEQVGVAPSVSVVIAARNEAGNIQAALERMPAFPGALEVIFVEGHSTDDTWRVIQEAQQKGGYPFTIKSAQQTGKGKGDAVRLGFELATHDLLMILDADLTVPPEDLPRFYEILASKQAEYVHGTRLVYSMEGQAMRPLNWLGNKFFSLLITFLLGQPISDSLCGTKCLSRAAYARLAAGRSYFGEFDPFGDFDLIFGAARLGLKMEEIPIRYRARTYGETQIHRFRDGWLLLRMCAFASKKLRFLPHIARV